MPNTVLGIPSSIATPPSNACWSSRELFQLPYRQTEGLGKSLVELMQIELAIPDYTSLAKRAAKLGVSLDVAKRRRTRSR